MSYTYPQYVDFSNPATPRVYNWEVASTTSEQDAAFQLQQDPQQSAQEHDQPQHISPSQLQLQQLPPLPLPAHQHQQHSASGSPQDSEHTHQLQQLLQLQPQLQMLQQQLPPHHQTIIIQVAPAQAQPRYRFETVTAENFIHAGATGERPRSSGSRGTSKAPLRVDTPRASSSSSAAAPATSLGPSGGVHAHSAGGPSRRIPRPRAHVQSAHPYRRPQSRAASSSGGSPPGAGVGEQAPVRSHRVSELQSTLTSVDGVPSFAKALPAMPTVGTVKAVSCPAQSSWHEGLVRSTNLRCVRVARLVSLHPS